ncbi:MAG: hypothetical protein ISR65_14815 [Bacteriovoracaceae bacterium]|nr:hypothetical protein [Bacteriovoracaceae bacterium]
MQEENNEVTKEQTETPQNKQQAPKQNNQEQEKCKYVEGQKLKFIRVRFPGNAKSFPFLVGKNNFYYGQKVMAMSDRGIDVGYINSIPYEVAFEKSMLPIRTISNLASDEDLEKQSTLKEREKKAEVLCLRLIEELKLNMNLTHVEIIQFGKKTVFYFNAPERVDFRELIKGLVSNLKTRIELRQISVRDRAAAIGAISACGRQNCCSYFLKGYGNTNIKMAKNQNLALIPSKINGVCGQLKCCMKFEDQVYTKKRKTLPKEGQIIKTKNNDVGKVLKLHLLVEQFDMLTDQGKIRRYLASQYLQQTDLSKSYEFPKKFEHVINETKDIIGANDDTQMTAPSPTTSEGPKDTQAAQIASSEKLEKDSPQKSASPKDKPHYKKNFRRNKPKNKKQQHRSSSKNQNSLKKNK